MPELPEVQTTVNFLRNKIIGLKIVDFWADKEKPIRQAGGAAKFKKMVVGAKIKSVWRRAKYIVVDLEGPYTIFIHQKISGHLLYGKWQQLTVDNKHLTDRYGQRSDGEWISKEGGPLKNDRKNQYIRLIFFLSNGYQLALSDLRRFGRVILVKDDKLTDVKELKGLGPEPFDLSLLQFKKLFRKSFGGARDKRGKLKPVLMDQTFVAGIGNIYADEILWEAGLHPLSRVEHLLTYEIEKIYRAMIKILKKAVELRGSSMDDYRLPSGEMGRAQLYHRAYQKTGDKCAKHDGGVIERIKIGQRSAHFCPKHQVLK